MLCWLSNAPCEMLALPRSPRRRRHAPQSRSATSDRCSQHKHALRGRWDALSTLYFTTRRMARTRSHALGSTHRLRNLQQVRTATDKVLTPGSSVSRAMPRLTLPHSAANTNRGRASMWHWRAQLEPDHFQSRDRAKALAPGPIRIIHVPPSWAMLMGRLRLRSKRWVCREEVPLPVLCLEGWN
ncbi:hypothetical protein L1887_54804 [Cichorium endivia]|nr:hypothetical protein L1887_54804 [Cichorium endivia]